MHHAGYTMQDPGDLSASPGIDAPGTQTSPGLSMMLQPTSAVRWLTTAWLTLELEALTHRSGRRCEEQMQARQESFEDTETSALWSWRLRAACRQVDSAVFFPPDGERPPQRDARETRAKAICASCPVLRQCAAYAIRYGERYGVWGGLSEREREALALRPDLALAIVPTAEADKINDGRPSP
jgi:WhiB family redox-sensing transcriptional regulator